MLNPVISLYYDFPSTWNGEEYHLLRYGLTCLMNWDHSCDVLTYDFFFIVRNYTPKLNLIIDLILSDSQYYFYFSIGLFR